jgi:hypothetical protein
VRLALPTGAPDASWWPTPTATANHFAPSMRKWPSFARFQDEVGTGRLEAALWEWAMGFPDKWTDCGHSATRSSRKSQNSSAD